MIGKVYKGVKYRIEALELLVYNGPWVDSFMSIFQNKYGLLVIQMLEGYLIYIKKIMWKDFHIIIQVMPINKQRKLHNT